MRFGDNRGQSWAGGDVADLPAGDREALARAADTYGAFPHAGACHERDMFYPERQMLIHLVAQCVAIMGENERGDQIEFLCGEHLAAGIHRRVEYDQLGLIRKCGAQRVFRQMPVRCFDPHAARHGAQQAQYGQIGVVKRLDQHDFVAWFDECHQLTASASVAPDVTITS